MQYAIEGKLVKQDPNIESASALLERRIKAEKEKSSKKVKLSKIRTNLAPIKGLIKIIMRNSYL